MESRHRAILLISVPILAANIWCAIRLYLLNARRVAIKEDYASVNGIQNGLLSVDMWKDHIQRITTNKVEDFQLSTQEENTFKVELEKMLQAFITEFNREMQRKQPTFKGKVRKIAFKTFVDVRDLHRNAPEFAQAAINEIKKPENARKFKGLVLSQLNGLAEQTHGNTNDASARQKILAKYGAQSMSEFDSKVRQRIDGADHAIRAYAGGMIATLFLFLSVWWLARNQRELHTPLFAASTAFAFVLLLTGLSLPMIEIDARIKNLDFFLLGEDIRFEDQILYYRSKSIMQVVKIMMAAGRADSFLVGILILAFSILFPISKLACTQLYLFGPRKWKHNGIIYFFAFNSGKWAMTDVTVVAIFMSFIGFRSVLNDQLKSLDIHTQSLTSITTNQTSLEPGFILFLLFVLFGLVLSVILKKMTQRSLRAPGI